MKRKGKQRLPVNDSIIYSTFIFQIASGNNYAQKIFEAIKKPTSIIVRQLKILEEKGFVNSTVKEDKTKFPMQKIRIYEVNWNKIIGEFFRLIKEHKDEIIETHNRLKTNIQKEKLDKLHLLEDKNFIENMKKNKYLLEALKQYFSTISKIKQCSLSQALGYFIFFGNFDFIYSTHPSIYGFLSQEETMKEMKEIKKEDKPFPKNKEEWEALRDISKSTMDKLQEHQNTINIKIKELKEKDKDFNNILLFNEIRNLLGFDLSLQIALNEATELTAFYILKNNFKESELKDYQNNLFFPYSKRYKEIPKEEVDNVKNKLDELGKKAIDEFYKSKATHKEKDTP